MPHFRFSTCAALTTALLCSVAHGGFAKETVKPKPVKPRAATKPPAAPTTVTSNGSGTYIDYTLPKAGRVSLAVYDASGAMVRTLSSGLQQSAGKNRLFWDGMDSQGKPVEPGSYSWKLLLSQGMKAEYMMVLGTSTGINRWPAQHGGIMGVAVQGDDLYITAGLSEGSPQTVKTTLNDKYQWATPSLEGWEGGQDIAIDGDNLYFQSNNESSHKQLLYIQDAATGKVKAKYDPVLPEVTAGKPSPANRVDAAGGELVCASVTGALAWLDTQNGKALDTATISDGLADVAIRGKGQVLAISGSKVVALSRDNKTATECINGLISPSRIAVDRTDGSIWIAEAGDSQQVKHFDKNFKLIQTLGRKGGRAEGLYHAEDFLAVSDIAADGKGGFVISESDSAPRRTAHFDGNGKLIKEWYGGQQYYTFTAINPGDPTHVWMDSHWGWVTEVQVDWQKRDWKVRACYKWGGDTDPMYVARFQMAQQFSVRSLDLNKDGKKETYITAGHFPGSLFYVDEAAGKLKPVALMSGMGSDSYWEWGNTPPDKVPVAWKEAMKKAGGNIDDSRSRTEMQGYTWADTNNDFEIQADELKVGNGQRVPHLFLANDMSLYLNLDLGKGVGNPAWQKFSPQGFTNAGYPIWDWTKREVGPVAGFNQTMDLRPDASGNIYTIHQGSAGDGFSAPDTWNPLSHGIGWPANLLDSNGVIKWDKNGKKLWQVGNHASRNALPGQLDYPVHFAGTVYNTVGVCDKIEQPVVFWTDDGLYAGGLFDRRADDGLPARVYKYFCGGTVDFDQETGLALIQSDLALGGSLIKLGNGDVAFIGSGYNNCPVFRVTGWDEFQRQSGNITVKKATPDSSLTGEGLKGEYFTGGKLEGAPVLTETDKWIWFDAVKKPPWMVSRLWPEDALKQEALSARWTGTIEPKFTEDYTFSLYGRYGTAKLWVAGQLVAETKPSISDMGGHWKVFSIPVPLRAGHKYQVKVERLGAKDAAFHLNWESVSQAITHITPESMYPTTDSTLPTITLRASVPRAFRPAFGEKAAKRGEWILTRSGAATGPLDVSLIWKGTAKANAEYEALPEKVQFATGETEVRIPVRLRSVAQDAAASVELIGQPALTATYLLDGTDGSSKMILSDPQLQRIAGVKVTAEGGRRIDWADPKIRADLLHNIVDGSGLDRSVDPPLNDIDIQHSWFCEFVNPDTTIMNFDLGALTNIGDIRIWNLNSTSAHGVGWGQGESVVAETPRVKISVATQSDGPWTDLGTIALHTPSGKAPDPGDLIPIGKEARYVRFGFSNPIKTLTFGLGEVEFYGTQVN